MCIIYCSQSENQDSSQEPFSHSCQPSFGSGLTLKEDLSTEAKHCVFGVKVNTQHHFDRYHDTTNRKKSASTKTTNSPAFCTVSTESHSTPHISETAPPLPGSESKEKMPCPNSGHSVQVFPFDVFFGSSTNTKLLTFYWQRSVMRDLNRQQIAPG